MNFEVYGPDDGIPVVFLHAVGIDSWMWKKVLIHLDGVQAFLIDLPGHGHSGTSKWTSLEDTAAAVSDIVKERCPQGSHLAALSLGSYVGLWAMAQNPALFGSAVLSGIHAGHMPRRWLMYVMSALMAPFATRPYMARRTASMFGVEPAETDSYVKSATLTRASAFRRATNDVVAFEMPASVKRIRTPVLFAAGSNEHPLILDSLKKYESALPFGSSVTIPDGGHGWPAKKPETFASLLQGNIAATARER